MIKPPNDDDIRDFPRLSVIDSCAISNLLGSRLLTDGTARQKRYFIVTRAVEYECLTRRSSNPNPRNLAAMELLRSKLDEGDQFQRHSMTVGELIGVAQVHDVAKLGMGEMASLVVAERYGHGFVTDERSARALARGRFPKVATRTTSHLAGWLVYKGEFRDADIDTIKKDSVALRGAGHLGPYIDKCFEHALMLLLKDRNPPPAPPPEDQPTC